MDLPRMPILQKVIEFQEQNPISFHVPGHKNGTLFPNDARPFFRSILPLDLTELPGLDDLHAPQEMIREAEELAAAFFGAQHTFFLVGGSTAGNLAMLLATCSAGDDVIVQRNCHKSIMNGLELAGARPVFIAPEYDEVEHRYLAPSEETLQLALRKYPSAKAVVLTYPDYFGKTFNINEMIDLTHAYHIPVLVDEAHGVHFSIQDEHIPHSSLALGADVVVQSAHKMAPAMTMASYLHIQSSLVQKERVAHYLQVLQSSSPSYPLLASLDIARAFLQSLNGNDVRDILTSVEQLRNKLDVLSCSTVRMPSRSDDPLKITLHMKSGYSGKAVAALFESEGVYPELATEAHVLFIHGLKPFTQEEEMDRVIKNVQEKLKRMPYHAIMDTEDILIQSIGELELSYAEMKTKPVKHVSYDQAEGYVAAEAVIPYPPGIPILLRGERISKRHLQQMKQLHDYGISIQTRNQTNTMSVFEEGIEDT